MICPMNLNIGN